MRKFSAYELNQLQKANLDPKDYEDTEEPVEYITGLSEFAENEFAVDQRVLIPRPETEMMLDIALNFVQESWKGKKKLIFADVGTGSGALGLSFANWLLKRNITFNAYLSDLFEDVLTLANQNASKIIKNRIKKSKSKITFIKSDLLADFNTSLKFDIIFANLPYIPSNRIDNLEPNVKDFEPIEALDGGEDGTTLIMKFLEQAESFIKKSGIVILEVDDSHDQTFLDKNYNELQNYWEVEIKLDSNSKNRFWICKIK